VAAKTSEPDGPATASRVGRRRALRVARHLGTAGVAVVAIVGVLATFFGRAVAIEPAAAEQTRAAASLDILDDQVGWQGQSATVFTEATDNMLLAVGESVRTNADGFAQIDWSDGSLARLDGDSQLTIVDLQGGALAPEIEVGLDVGRVWNRVQDATGSVGRYEIQTGVGVAAVRGTAFSIACTVAQICTFIVAVGQIQLTTPDGGVLLIGEGETVVVGPSGENTGTPIVPPPDGETPGATPGDGGTPDGTPPEPGFVVTERSQQSVDDLRDDDDWIDDNLGRDDDTGRFGSEGAACAATVNGHNASFATTPQTAIVLDVNDVAPVHGVTVAPLDSYAVFLSLAGRSFDLGGGVRTGQTTFDADIEVADYAVFGVGLYEVGATTTGTVCRKDGYILITGRSPLSTIAGILSAIVTLLGLAGASASISRGGRQRSVTARRLSALVAGSFGGAGMAVLLQQYGVFPLSLASLIAAIAALGILSGSLPRAPKAAPAAEETE